MFWVPPRGSGGGGGEKKGGAGGPGGADFGVAEPPGCVLSGGVGGGLGVGGGGPGGGGLPGLWGREGEIPSATLRVPRAWRRSLM